MPNDNIDPKNANPQTVEQAGLKKFWFYYYDIDATEALTLLTAQKGIKILNTIPYPLTKKNAVLIQAMLPNVDALMDNVYNRSRFELYPYSEKQPIQQESGTFILDAGAASLSVNVVNNTANPANVKVLNTLAADAIPIKNGSGNLRVEVANTPIVNIGASGLGIASNPLTVQPPEVSNSIVTRFGDGQEAPSGIVLNQLQRKTFSSILVKKGTATVSSSVIDFGVISEGFACNRIFLNSRVNLSVTDATSDFECLVLDSQL